MTLMLLPLTVNSSIASTNIGALNHQLGSHAAGPRLEAGTSFSVWAPNADSVSVVGTFNGWDSTVDRLKKLPDGVWRGASSAARPGDQYMFMLDGQVERRDPRAREVTYSGKCVVPSPNPQVSRLASPPPLDDLVMYQMHVGTFYDPNPFDDLPGTLDDAILKLDHLLDLGVNCILLMPVNEFPFERSWGYNPKDQFAIEQAYGGPSALRRFVSECHLRGIAVHVDIVHNHYGPGDLDLWDFDTSKKSPPSAQSPSGIYFYRDPKKSESPWGPRPDFGKREVLKFISDQVRMWFDEYGVDGLRWDSTVNIRALGNGQEANPEGERMISRISKMIRREYPEKVSIAEDSPGDQRFDASWDYDFHHDQKGGVVENLVHRDPSEVDIADIAARLESSLRFRRVVYSENHDEVGYLNSKTRLLSISNPDDPLSLESRRTAALAAALVLTTPSIPMVFMGQEIGQTGPFHDSIPLSWDICPKRSGMHLLYRDLIHLRRGASGMSLALRSPRIRVLTSDDKEKLLAYRRYIPSRPESDIVVVVNLGNSSSTSPIPFPSEGKWHLAWGTGAPQYSLETPSLPEEVEVDSSLKVGISLPPRSAFIFARRPITLPPYPPQGHFASRSADRPDLSQPSSLSSPPLESPSPPPLAPPPPAMFISASFTDPPWSVGHPDLQMSNVEENVWQIDLILSHLNLVEIKIVDLSTGMSFGRSSPDQAPVPFTETLCEDCYPVAFGGPLSGAYRLTFNGRSHRLKLELRAESELDRVNVLSSSNGWSRTADPMYMVADHLWQADLTVYEDDVTEFVLSADGDLGKQWGANTGEEPPSEWSGLAEQMGPPVRVKPSSDVCRVLFNELTGDLSVRSLSPSEAPREPDPPKPRPAREENHALNPLGAEAEPF